MHGVNGTRACLAVALAALAALFVPVLPASVASATTPTTATTLSYDPATPLYRDQLLTVTAWAGTFTLGLGTDTTPQLPFSATAAQVEAALEALPAANVDGVGTAQLTVTGGTGGVFGGYHYRVHFDETAGPAGYPRLTATNVSLSGILAPSAVAQCVRCGDLRVPVGTPPPGGWPVVVLAHSGGFAFGSKDDGRMEAWAAELASAGFASFAVNYALAEPEALRPLYNVACDIDAPASGGPVCGQALRDGIDAMRADLQASIRWLRLSTQPVGAGGSGNPYGLNAGAVAILGESAGATGALEVMTRSDAPATVGVTGPSAAVQATVAIAGFQDDASQGPGDGPALVMDFTADPLGELFGMDMHDEGREVVSRAAAVGNLETRMVSWCDRRDTNGDGVTEPQHLPILGTPESAAQITEAVAFLGAQLGGAPATPAGGRFGDAGRSPFRSTPAQALAGTHTAVPGDFDGDGRDDLYLFGAGSTCDTVWFGRGDGTFTDPDEVVGGAYLPVPDHAGDAEVVAADLDGDGRDDLAWYEPATGLTQLWYGTATRAFDQVTVPNSLTGMHLTTGDFDGDGRDDLLLDSTQIGLAGVAFGHPTHGVLELAYLGTKVPTQDPYVGDVDGDGLDDVLWSDPVTGAALTLWHAGAGRTFTPTVLADLIPDIQVALADVNGDGTADPTLYAPSIHLTITFAGIPGGGFGLVAGRILDRDVDLSAADVDGDTRSDLLWTGAGGVEVAYGAPVGQPLFVDRVTAATPAGPAAQGDFDGDSRSDRVWSAAG